MRNPKHTDRVALPVFPGKRIDRVELPPIPGLPGQLRIDPEMGEWIRTSAALNRRTIQGEVLHRLERTFKAEKVRFRHAG
jgi:hypothetical protein